MNEQLETLWNVTTLGYNARGSAQALDTLMSEERVLLIDTRLKPWSYNPEWRQGALAKKYGKQYHYAGQFLGNEHYNQPEKGIKIADPDTGLRGLRQYLSEGYRLVLLCACNQYASCHRKTIIEMLCAISTPGVIAVQPEDVIQQKPETRASLWIR